MSGSEVELAVTQLAANLPKRYGATLNGIASLTLSPTRPISDYRKLVGALYDEGMKTEKLDTMIKFLVGDALVQAESIYGEEAACVYGDEIRWSPPTIANIMRCASAIPAELRYLDLSFRFYLDLYGAELTHKELQTYLNNARQSKASDFHAWRKQVLTEINKLKVDQLIEALPQEEKGKWRSVYKHFKQPHWRKLKGWITGVVTVPNEKQSTAKFIMNLLHTHIPSEGFSEMDYDGVQQAFADAMWEVVNACKDGQLQEDE